MKQSDGNIFIQIHEKCNVSGTPQSPISFSSYGSYYERTFKDSPQAQERCAAEKWLAEAYLDLWEAEGGIIVGNSGADQPA